MLYILQISLCKGKDREAINKYLKRDRDVKSWFSPWPNSIYVLTRMDCEEMRDSLFDRFGHFPVLISDITDSDIEGYVSEVIWDYFEKWQEIVERENKKYNYLV